MTPLNIPGRVQIIPCTPSPPLRVDPARLGCIFITGQMVEAQLDGRTTTVDLGALDRDSLRVALTRMGERGVQSLVESLLGHYNKSDI